MRRLLPLWLAFALVHVVVGALALFGPGQPLGDVQWVYPGWVELGLRTGQWVGIQRSWVYPVVALVPMVLSRALGAAAYPYLWMVLVAAADAAAMAVLLGRSPDRSRFLAAWGWIGFLLLLGPISVGRIDSFAVAAALAGVAVLARRPRVAALLLTLAAWVKVWPAVLVGAAVIADARRRVIATVAITVSATIAVVVLILGGDPFSFVAAQTGRGLEVEAPLVNPFLLAALVDPQWHAYYDTGILAFQVTGPGVTETAALATPLLVLAAGGILVLGIVAMRRGADANAVLAWLGLALVATMIATNKVGSPQYITWLAVPVVAGVLALGPGLRDGFGTPALVTLAIAPLTCAIYPYFFDALVALQPGMVLVLTLRNLLVLGLVVLGVSGLVRGIRSAPAFRPEPLPEGASA